MGLRRLDVGQSGKNRNVFVALSGQVSPRLRQELETLGFTVHERLVPGPLRQAFEHDLAQTIAELQHILGLHLRTSGDVKTTLAQTIYQSIYPKMRQ
jgi:hypothetical protein